MVSATLALPIGIVGSGSSAELVLTGRTIQTQQTSLAKLKSSMDILGVDSNAETALSATHRLITTRPAM